MIIFYSYLTVAVLMCFVWLYYRATKNPGIVDVAWSVGHWIAGSIFIFANAANARTLLIWFALSVWALRLAGYLFWTRVRQGEVDKRYQKISDNWSISPALGFFLNFQLQGILIMLIVSCLYFTGQSTEATLNRLDSFGLLLVLIGVVFETIADIQLHRFKKSNQGKVCNIGLWHYSRHPNYFFEWMTWLGFSMTAVSTSFGWMGLISPITVYIIVTKITGPITERSSIESKGQFYRDYQNNTRMFFPLPTKKG